MASVPCTLEAGHLDPGAFNNIENYIDLAVLPVDAGLDDGMVKALGAVKKFDLVDVGFQVFLIEGNFSPPSPGLIS